MAAKKKSVQQVGEEEVKQEPEGIITSTQTGAGEAVAEPSAVDEPKTENTEGRQQDVETPRHSQTQEAGVGSEEKEEPMEQGHDTGQAQQSQASDFFGAPPEEKKGALPKALLAVLLLVVVGGVAGFMFLRGGGQFLGSNIEASPVPAAEEAAFSPEPSPEAKDIDLTEFKVRVLNGTGTAGEAGKVKDLLKEAGFEDIATGNAPAQNNKVTTVSAVSDVPEAAVKSVEDALKESFTVEAGDELDEDSEYDIVVTTGGAKASADSEETEE